MGLMEILKDQKLQTSLDPYLGICEACECPMRAKVWSPVDVILKHIQPEEVEKLDPGCWILKSHQSSSPAPPLVVAPPTGQGVSRVTGSDAMTFPGSTPGALSVGCAGTNSRCL